MLTRGYVGKFIEAVVWLALGGFVSACRGSPPPALSGVARDLAGVECPEENIVVLETLTDGDDTVFVVDACGKRLRIVQSLAVPTKNTELLANSAETPLELPNTLGGTVPGGIVRIVRAKVEGWCHLRARPPEGSQTIAFFSETPAEQAECRERVAAMLRPMGVEPGAYGEADVYWFELGQYVFVVRESLHLADKPDKSVAMTTSPNLKRKERWWYGRLELGGGYLTASGGRDFDGATLSVRPELGAKLTSDLALGLAVTNHRGLTIDSQGDYPNLFELGLVGVYYPIQHAGLHLDVLVSAVSLGDNFGDDSEGGTLVGGAVGFDLGSRSKGQDATSWTGATFTLRGFYTTHEAAGFEFHGGLYAW
jgi:hypothetical protein